MYICVYIYIYIYIYITYIYSPSRLEQGRGGAAHRALFGRGRVLPSTAPSVAWTNTSGWFGCWRAPCGCLHCTAVRARIAKLLA